MIQSVSQWVVVSNQRSFEACELVCFQLRLVLCDLPSHMFEMIENFAIFFKAAYYPQGVVELYRKIADQGYTIMFLTNR